jgi:hypothetical protein
MRLSFFSTQNEMTSLDLPKFVVSLNFNLNSSSNIRVCLPHHAAADAGGWLLLLQPRALQPHRVSMPHRWLCRTFSACQSQPCIPFTCTAMLKATVHLALTHGSFDPTPHRRNAWAMVDGVQRFGRWTTNEDKSRVFCIHFFAILTALQVFICGPVRFSK